MGLNPLRSEVVELADEELLGDNVFEPSSLRVVCLWLQKVTVVDPLSNAFLLASHSSHTDEADSVG